jgi:hypothetical protein
LDGSSESISYFLIEVLLLKQLAMSDESSAESELFAHLGSLHDLRSEQSPVHATKLDLPEIARGAQRCIWFGDMERF